MRNARLDEAQAGIKIAGRNTNNLRYADGSTVMAEIEEVKSLLMKVQEESEKVDLKLNIQKTKIMASGPINSVSLLRFLHRYSHDTYNESLLPTFQNYAYLSCFSSPIVCNYLLCFHSFPQVPLMCFPTERLD